MIKDFIDKAKFISELEAEIHKFEKMLKDEKYNYRDYEQFEGIIISDKCLIDTINNLPVIKFDV